MLRQLAALVAPPRCGVCEAGCGVDEPVCSRCAVEFNGGRAHPLNLPGVDQAWAATRYEGAPRRLVSALKFGRRLALAAVAAEAIAAATPAESWAGRALVPVPADPWRLRIRGFDPAALIAGELGRRVELPLRRCLARRHAPRQTGRPRAERLAQPPSVGALVPPPARAILVDDVVTTGATLSACAAALRRAGAGEVLALAFARA